MNKRVPANRFLEAFREEWQATGQDNNKAFDSDRTWSDFMLNSDDSFLGRVSSKLSLEICREWYRWDCVYYMDIKKSNLLPYGCYPACVDVAIEHENGSDVEQEMYKMLMLIRSPLRVLIFYDYPECEMEDSENKQNWLRNKFNELLEIGHMVEVEWPEAENTEYLFLVGNQIEVGELLCWRYLVVKSGEFGQCKNFNIADLSHLVGPEAA